MGRILEGHSHIQYGIYVKDARFTTLCNTFTAASASVADVPTTNLRTSSFPSCTAVYYKQYTAQKCVRYIEKRGEIEPQKYVGSVVYHVKSVERIS